MCHTRSQGSSRSKRAETQLRRNHLLDDMSGTQRVVMDRKTNQSMGGLMLKIVPRFDVWARKLRGEPRTYKSWD